MNSKPLLRDLEACREFMTGYSWQNLSWGMYCIEDIIWWREDEFYFFLVKAIFYGRAEQVCEILFFTTRK